ncbi:flagellar brake domain-containing protein [Halobacillus yeomjeoni]|uniref:flagellar brake protein n=1 Tax=Halobacillus yeomjeoni TaxID=311194 RepID=UPI001CD538A8|nr:flagellar brake domain-containing protein [Halobacillus yeomjeoni]MCA0983002.1 flagellar brake domain-containing protein [Halobacillus yeomjeoni]
MQRISVGMSITLEAFNNQKNEQETYKCKLVDKDDQCIYIDYPVNQNTGRTGFFLEGTQFKASFVGKDNSVYRFDTEVVARKKMKIPVILLSFPQENDLVRIQRRKYVRVEASIDISLRKANHTYTTISHDISGGGIALAKRPYENVSVDEEVELTLVLPMNSGEYQYIETKGKVVRLSEVKQGSLERLSIEFKDMTEKKRQWIIQYSFEKQMEMRKLGMS